MPITSEGSLYFEALGNTAITTSHFVIEFVFVLCNANETEYVPEEENVWNSKYQHGYD